MELSVRSLLDWESDEEAEGGDLVLGGGSWLHRDERGQLGTNLMEGRQRDPHCQSESP